MKPLIQNLLVDGPVVLDGGWSTEFRSLGLEPGECPDLWNLTKPEVVESVARSYVDAGSRIILTNTFRSNRLALEPYALVDKIEKLNRKGIELSKNAIGRKGLVFASIGPARNLSMQGKLPGETNLMNIFKEQAEICANAGADGIVLESFFDIHEARIAVLAAKSAGIPVVASVVFDYGQSNDRIASGHSPEQVATILEKAGADIIGANCGLGIEQYLPICKRLRAATKLPIWMKPNAGSPTFIRNRIIYPTTSRNFSMYAQVLSNLGADFIGGCCGTTPEYIFEMARNLKKRYRNRMMLQE